MTLTIGKKISLAFSAILLLIITMGITVYTLNSSIQLSSEEIGNDDVPGVILYLQILDEIGDLHSNVVEYSTGEIDEVDDFYQNYEEFKNYFLQLKPLESNSQSEIDKMDRIELLVDSYVKDITEQVFEKYDPLDESWAKKIVDELEHKQGAELEQLLDSLKDQEFAEALTATSIEEAVQDDLPGVRYYLELVDESGDMLASLSEYVGGESDEEEEFRGNAEDFARYFNLLEPLEKKPTEIRDLITINRLYNDIIRTAGAVFRRYDPDSRTNALNIIDKLEHNVINELEKILDSSSLEEKNDAESALHKLSETLNTVNAVIIFLTLMSLLIGAVISYWITNTILRAVGGEPTVIEEMANEVAKGNINQEYSTNKHDQTGIYAALQSMIEALRFKVEMTEKIAQGDLSSDIKLASKQDSLGIALNRMQLNFKEMVEQANAFATGDYKSQISPRSQQDEFGIALSHMMQQVTDRNSQVEAQSWLKTQVVKIGKLSQGVDDIQKMAQQLISELANILQAGHVAFYLLEEQDKDSDTDYYKLLASYAYVERKNISNRYAEGEGLIGQCALEKHTILLTNVPDDYIQISSGLGEKKPFNIMVMPILFENNCIAVIEIASFQHFTENQMEFLNQSIVNLGITMNSLIGRKRIVELLQQSQSQTEELQSQSEELRATNEELEQKANKLNLQSNALQSANKDLEDKKDALETKQRDIELKNQQIEEKAQELTIASKYKSEFLANMSHELRTPLNSLLLLAKGLAGNKKGNLTPVQVEDARVIYDGGNSLLTLINDIMDLSKVEAGKLTIHNEPVSLELLTRNLTKMFNPIADDRGLNFLIKIADDIKSSFSSDSLRVEQILRNLLSNAMKFTPQGDVILSIEKPNAELSFSHSELDALNCIAFAVIDTGIGIPEDKQRAIFEAFQQEDGTTSRKYGGTGLGLTIARELSRLLGGEIHLASTLGEGSQFTLYLSAELLQKEPPSFVQIDAIPEPPTKATEFAEETINDDRNNLTSNDSTLLIIEDDPLFIKIVRNLAQQHGYKCLLANEGSSAIQLAQQYQPDGIILDIGLPGLDGFQVINQLNSHSETRHIPVQVISGHTQEKPKILSLGAIGFLSKPVEEQQLQAVFKKIKKLTESETRHILLVEDDVGNQKATAQLLENDNIKIKSVATGKAGLEEIISEQYDAIILDLGLPDMSGFELLKAVDDSELKNIPPIIIYTGREISEKEQKELDQYSASIVIKGVGSAERLEDDLSLFLHQADKKIKQEVNLVHDEVALLKERKVLLVDDDMRNCYALSKMLMEIGIVVELAENGKEAITLLEQSKDFELILMDTMMPVMDGNKATALIRQMDHYKNIPIIALTAKTMPEDKEKCLQAGASEYITKPVDFDNLVSIMRIWLFA
ncbi:response regulator [Psychromonas sp. Urea-02u-13]|uniref:response regulator n=1 Tax=Psychromonas sp. Urea-02u-13 TaxID=2058326 RepID=UPI000C335542|nr:response regulator [Psychromonas sp. Urea-02u-13]PKG38698.1 histidine kinase [Psychromonas sp. Urea-02u-13]